MVCRAIITAAALFAVLPAAPALADGAHHGPRHTVGRGTSTNWSGYAVPGTGATHVIGTWTQPSVTCAPRENSWSSPWVGIDGDTSGTVEQIGTDSDCQNGTPVYYAWYEMYPKFPVNLSLAIKPGDTVSASVTTGGRGSFTLTIRDTTTGGSFTTTQKLKNAKLGSAEVIAEAPSSGGVLPLANFGTVGFSAATVNGKSIGSFNPDRIDMVSGTTTKATTSALSAGTAFSVKWNHA